jgi:hypothetical protein
LVQLAERPEQDLGEVVTGSISGEVVGEVSSPWMLAEEARTDNEQFVLHASLPPCWNSPTDQLHEAKQTHTETIFIAKRAYRTL